MGQSTSAIKYSELVGEAKKGETPSIRNIQLHGSDPKEVLYPGMETMLDYFKNSVKKYGNEICIYTKKILSPAVDKTPAKVAIGTITYKQEKTEVKNLARGILKLGLASEVDSDIKGEKIRPLGVFANTREEWFSLIIATWYSGTTSVPLYSTLGKPGIKYIMMESQFSTLFIADELCKTFIDFYKENKIEYLKNIVLFDEKSKKIFDDAKLELNVYTYNQIKEIGAAAKDVKFPKINSGSIDTICYTSGTTGVPKGVVTTQKMLVAYITGLLVVDFLSVIDHNYKYMANLPLAHVYERNICLAVIFLGAKACFGNPYTLKDDLLLFKPHIVSLVPRMADRLHKALMEKASQLKGFKLALFNHAFKSKLNSVKKGVLTDMIYDKIVFNHFRNGVGGNLKFIVSGAAMADPTVCNALQALFSCRLIIGYGCSETCGAVTITHQDSTDMTHIGFPIMSIQTKLIDVPELNYKTDAEIPKGELCVKGAIVMQRYYKQEDKTKEVVDTDGWLHTGDIAMLLTNGNLRIIDRAKNVFKLSQGEYIIPDKIEMVYNKSKYVLQMFIYGDSMHSYLVGVVIPEIKYCCANALNGKVKELKLDDLCSNKEFNKEVLTDLQKLAKSNGLNSLETIKKLVLSSSEMTVENDLLTPTMKLKRHKAYEVYKSAISEIYTME